MAKPTRNRKGQFVKGGGRKSTALARRGPTTVVVRRRRSSSTAVARRAPARRSSGGGGMVTGLTRYVGGVRGDDLLASGGVGFVVNKRRALVETVVNYAPDAVRGVGAYGVLAAMAGLLSHFGIGRRYTSPIARACSIIAVNKLTTRGALYEPGDLSASLAGDDEMGADDDFDVSGLAVLEGDYGGDGEAVEGDGEGAVADGASDF